MIDESLLALVDAEAAPDREEPVSLDELEREMARLDEELRLLDPANLHVFVTWYTLGGVQSAPSPMEIRDWPAAMRQDFSMLMRRLHKLRRSHVSNSHKPGE